ncbi:hypothetical protein L3Q82_016825 [Scortum barcoo]|uniref:Uncharacterized protein n=1 Tax=Scortum barcoo TaxID=214431 RepID=A0ACB8XBZ0_9TELE|nr:hypothetical protein L3Q82_016825 [Scortum barcoo]
MEPSGVPAAHSSQPFHLRGCEWELVWKDQQRNSSGLTCLHRLLVVNSGQCRQHGGAREDIVLLRHGLARSGTEYGPLTDLPDWSFADGRPAPPMKGQQRRKQEREVLARRIVMLNSEVDRGMEAWSKRVEEAERTEEHRKSLLLKPKGKLLLKKKSQS